MTGRTGGSGAGGFLCRFAAGFVQEWLDGFLNTSRYETTGSSASGSALPRAPKTNDAIQEIGRRTRRSTRGPTPRVAAVPGVYWGRSTPFTAPASPPGGIAPAGGNGGFDPAMCVVVVGNAKSIPAPPYSRMIRRFTRCACSMYAQ